ncbi:hypothetical protein WMY93_017988 [Mugilogobius chulae]|uniref:Uncharacterized protein n=1 Tax=Mugilogobius chulae TaxID=88201 RepID=A0AAW0NLU2_9GOBI
MQDDLLMDKTHHHHQQDQELEPSSHPPASSSTPTLSSSLEPTSCSSASSSDAESSGGGGGGKEKSPMESPLLPGLSFPHQTQDSGGSLPSPNASFGSAWSTGSAADDSYFPGMPAAVNGTMLFQNFPHVNPVFGGNFTQQQRRSPVSPNFPQRNAYHSFSKSSSTTWNNNHQNWSSTPSGPWSGAQHGRDPRRAVGVGVGVGGVPSPLNPISPMKKPFGTGSVIAPPKFPRGLGPKAPWMDEIRADSNNILPFQERNRPFDAFNLHSLGNSLMDMIRTDHEKGRLGLNFHHPGDHIMPLNSRSCLFPFEDGFLDDMHGDPSLTPPNRCPSGERLERFSRKVFVGGCRRTSTKRRSPTVSGGSDTWWWTGRTKPRANPTSHQKVTRFCCSRRKAQFRL